jgi:Cytidylate kinase-like family
MAKTRIVTISHATGAGGTNIGRSVAKGLGFRYVDEEIIQLAAERYGVDAELVADAERRKSLLDRILNDIVAAPMMDPTGGMGMLPPDGAAPSSIGDGEAAPAEGGVDGEVAGRHRNSFKPPCAAGERSRAIASRRGSVMSVTIGACFAIFLAVID